MVWGSGLGQRVLRAKVNVFDSEVDVLKAKVNIIEAKAGDFKGKS